MIVLEDGNVGMNKKTTKFIRKYAHQNDGLFLDDLYGFIEKTENPEEGDYYKFGYETFGIILYGFCVWMINDMRREGIKRILFFSRDGHVIKRAFELFPESKEFDYEYIYVSRRSLRVPQLFMEGIDKKQSIVPTRYITVEDLLYSIGLDANEYLEEINKVGLDPGQVIKGNDVDKGNIKELIDLLWPDVIENSQKEYIAAKQYIDQLRLRDSVSVVDIGWRGSMQFFLQRMIDNLGGDAALHGYYMTLSSDMLKDQIMRGFLGNVDNKSGGCDLLRGYIGLIELMFSYEDGSAEKYIINGNEAKVIKHECEYKHNEGSIDEIESIKEIQRGALDFVKKYIAETGSCRNEIEPDDAFAYLNEFATNPSRKDVEMFANFTFQNNGTITNLVECKAITYYLLHPKQLEKDLYVSRWRIGFLKKLFKIKMPYKMLFETIMYIAKR